MIEGVIYRYKSPSGKYYIGQTTNEKRRHWEFLNKKRYGGPKIMMARNKYGPENFEYAVLVKVTGDNPEEVKKHLNTLEIGFIRMYDSYNNGYNATIGGESVVGHHHTSVSKSKISEGNRGKYVSEETKLKMSNSLKGRYSPFTGKNHTDETKRKLRESKIGRHRVYNPDGTYRMVK